MRLKTFKQYAAERTKLLAEDTDNEAEWRRLFDHLLEMYKGGPFKNPQYHQALIRLLQNVGLVDEANGLEMIRPSQDDIDFGNTPMYGIGRTLGTLGDVLSSKNKQQGRESFRAAHKAYWDAVERIADIVEEKAKHMKWSWAD